MPSDPGQAVLFRDEPESTWTWDEKAQKYYHHHFYEFEPDLNIANPKVRDEIVKIMGFWLELGVSGFRVDALPFVIDDYDLRDKDPDPHDYLRDFRDFLSWRKGDAILLAEANVTGEKVREYFGNGDKLQMMFDFQLNRETFATLATGKAKYMMRAMEASPGLPEIAQWATFLRNHDELNLEGLPADEMATVFEKFAPEPGMRIYDRGIRRRLAPMLEGDPRRLRMALSLLFAMPGTPVLWYGDELGMGEDLSLPERNSVRTPMQWSPAHAGGFSTAPREYLLRPPVAEGPYSYEKVNVEAQKLDSDSLLNWVERAIRMRKDAPELGARRPQMIEVEHPAVIAHWTSGEQRCIAVFHNVGAEPARLTLPEGQPPGEVFVDLFSDAAYPTVEGRCVELGGYGFRVLGVEPAEGAAGLPHRSSS